jgi:hypothetical protein
MTEQRTTYETTWYDVPVTCCSWCHFVQFEDFADDNHTDWCNRDAAVAEGEGR